MSVNCADNPQDCPMLPRIEALEAESAHNKDAHKEFYARLDASHTSVAVIEERLNQIKDDTEDIKTALQEVQPAKDLSRIKIRKELNRTERKEGIGNQAHRRGPDELYREGTAKRQTKPARRVCCPA